MELFQLNTLNQTQGLDLTQELHEFLHLVQFTMGKDIKKTVDEINWDDFSVNVDKHLKYILFGQLLMLNQLKDIIQFKEKKPKKIIVSYLPNEKKTSKRLPNLIKNGINEIFNREKRAYCVQEIIDLLSEKYDFSEISKDQLYFLIMRQLSAKRFKNNWVRISRGVYETK